VASMGAAVAMLHAAAAAGVATQRVLDRTEARLCRSVASQIKLN
tara:strand:+ start:90 stop:221 length:132 start_codon:yes stop_codon:yes gene_type:complete